MKKIVGWQVQSLICPECMLTSFMKTGLSMSSSEEGWGEMCCDICRRKLRDVTKGYEGSKAEVPRDLRETKK